MAITVEQQAAQGFAANTTVHTTAASLSLTPGQMGFIWVMPSQSAAPITPPTVTGAGQTWTRFCSCNLTGVRPGMGYYCVGGTGSGQITLTFSANTELGIVMWVVNGADTDDPFAWIQGTPSNTNNTFINIYQQDMLDPVNNACFMGIFTGNPNGAADITADPGFTLIGRTAFPSPTNYSLGVQWRVGQDNVAGMVFSPGTIFSNGGNAWELRAASSAARRRGYTDIAHAFSTSSSSTFTFTAPAYASADPLFLVVHTARASGTPNAPTAVGGGVTWTQLDTTVYGGNLYRLTTLQATGPLDGSNVVVSFGGQAQESRGAYLIASEGAGALLQHPTGTALSTTTPSLTFGALGSPTSSQFAFFAGTATVPAGQTQIRPGAGWIQVYDDTAVVYPRHVQDIQALHPSAPDQTLYAEFRWTNDLVADMSSDVAANWAIHGLELAGGTGGGGGGGGESGANPHVAYRRRRIVRRR